MGECGRELPYQIKPRRAGDIAENYAACDKAARELGWTARYRGILTTDGNSVLQDKIAAKA